MSDPWTSDEKPSECVRKDCDCPKCRKKEVERREAEALSNGFVLGVAGAAIISAAAGSKRLLQFVGHILDAKLDPKKPAKAPKATKAKPKPKPKRERP